MADEEVKNLQGGDDGFPSFLTAPVENENEEYEYEYVEVPESEAETTEENLLEEENEFSLDDMLGDVSDDLDLTSNAEDDLPLLNETDSEADILSAATDDGLPLPEEQGQEMPLDADILLPEAGEEPVLESAEDIVSEVPETAVGSSAEPEAVSEVAGDNAEISPETEGDVLSPQGSEAGFSAEPDVQLPEGEEDQEFVSSEADTPIAAEDISLPESLQPEEGESPAEPAAVFSQEDEAFLLLPDSGIQTVDLDSYNGCLRIAASVMPGGHSWFWLERKQHLAEIGSNGADLEIRLPVPGANFVTLVKGGDQKLELFNRTHLRVENVDAQAFEAVDGDFILGNAGFDSGVVIEEFCAVNPADLSQTEMIFSEPAAGIISGPGTVAFVNGLRCLQWSFAETENYEKEQLRCLKSYSGSFEDKYFELSGNSPATEFAGNEEINSIHVNCGASTYGWNVSFENGVTMSLRDLREYQVRYGKMPDNAGIISCGDLQAPFSNIARIVVYESARYFSYR